MTGAEIAPRSALREALAEASYNNGTVRIADPDLRGIDWLVATPRGVFAVASDRVNLVIHGWFFGICRAGSGLFLFENCGHRNAGSNMGRIIHVDLDEDRLGAAQVLVTGLHNNCHQVAMIDDLLCVVDTANQAIRRYTLTGAPVDVRQPFPIAPPTDESGAYLHVNTIAKVGDRIGLVLHNGKAVPPRDSEVAWLDADWQVVERHHLPGQCCHDIVEDEAGRLWHSLSLAGDVIRSDGVRVHISDDQMTRGIALGRDKIAIGTSIFGPRHRRGTLNGQLVLLHRANLDKVQVIELPAAPTDLIAV
jgi:hypothetical protein